MRSTKVTSSENELAILCHYIHLLTTVLGTLRVSETLFKTRVEKEVIDELNIV